MINGIGFGIVTFGGLQHYSVGGIGSIAMETHLFQQAPLCLHQHLQERRQSCRFYALTHHAYVRELPPPAADRSLLHCGKTAWQRKHG